MKLRGLSPVFFSCCNFFIWMCQEGKSLTKKLQREQLQSPPPGRRDRIEPARFLCPWDSPVKNTSGLPFPPPGDLPDPGMERPHCRQTLYRLSHQGSQEKQGRRPGFSPWVRKISWRREWLPTPVSCLENPMDRGAWWVKSVGSQRIRHD